MAIDEELLAGLTDEEREAYLADESESDAIPPKASAEEEADDEHEDAEGAESGEESEEEGDEPAGKADDQAAAEDGEAVSDADAGEDEPESDAERPAPLLIAEAPENAGERLAEIAGEKESLLEQFDAGELTPREYQQKVDALSREERKIERELDRAELAQQMAEQQAAVQRDKEINTFLKAVSIPRDPEDPKFKDLDRAVRIVASLEESATKSVEEIMAEAYDLCVLQGKLPARGKPAKEAADPAGVKLPKSIKAPPTLAKLPAADATATDEGNRFSHLDRLDPLAREEAVAKMSDADREAYLKYA